MSYILDALRKADAQRERDASRGIHAHSAAPGVTPASIDARSRPGLWAGAGVVLVALAAAGWYLTRPAAPPASMASGVPASVSSPAVAAPSPAIAVAPPAQTAAVPATVISPPPPPPSVAPQVATPPMRGLPQTNVVPPSVAVTAAPRAPAPPAAPVEAAPIAAPLPADAPRVAISGGVYSPSPAQRMLIVNGQVFSEGSEIAPGITVEKIDPRTAILRFRGNRYTVAY